MYNSDKMYKRRIKLWGLDKNNKDAEMRAIARKTKVRLDQGKRSEVHVRGRAIIAKEVRRYWRRKGNSIEDTIATQASATPEAVKIVTPVPSRVATPTSLAVPEHISAAIRDYVAGSFASGNWVYDNPENLCHTRKVQGNPSKDLNDLTNHSVTACQLFSNGHYQEAGRILISLTSNFKQILLAEHPATLSQIFETVALVRLRGRNEISIAILRHFFALGEFVVGREHPLRLICGWLASADALHFDEILARCAQSVADHFESFVGPMHYSTLFSRTYYVNNTSHARGQGEELLQNLLGQCELHLGSSDRRTHLLRYALARCYRSRGQHAEALRVGQDLIAHIQYSQPQDGDYNNDYYALGLVMIAFSQRALGHMVLAEANLRKAIALQTWGWGARDGLAGLWLVTLEKWLVEMGGWTSAAEVREQRMGILDQVEIL